MNRDNHDKSVLKALQSTVRSLDRIVNTLEKIARSQEVQTLYYDNIGYDQVVCSCGHEMDATKSNWMKYCPMCGIKFDWRFNDDEI